MTASDQASAPPAPFLTVREVAARYRKSTSSIWSWAKASVAGFPAPVDLGPRTTRWRLEVLLAWEAARAGAVE